MKIRRIFVAILALGCYAAAGAQQYGGSDPLGTVSYCLPSTTLTFEVEAVRETFHAGPYAAYAAKYLGIDVRRSDAVAYTITDVRMTPYMEADQSRRYMLDASAVQVGTRLMEMTSSGLVSMGDASFGEEIAWRFPEVSDGDFSSLAVTSNLSSKATNLHRTGRGQYDKVSVSQRMVVEKSLEKRAAETAKMIFEVREKRYQIVTGDTDASYNGEALGAAVAELTRLEKEYMTMFVGYSEYETQKLHFDLVPEKNRSSQMYVAFRLSDTAGLLSADDLSGKPIVLEIAPEKISMAKAEPSKGKPAKDMAYIYYKVPAICNVRLSDGSTTLISGRVPIYQFGFESSYPVNVK